jgi:hypothetical protein
VSWLAMNSGKVENQVGLRQPIQRQRLTDIVLHEAGFPCSQCRLQAGCVGIRTRRSNIDERDLLYARFAQHALRRMGADETGASKDYDMLQDSAVLLRQGLG